MIASGLDEKIVKYQAKEQAAIITWAIASYFYLRAIKKAILVEEGPAYIEHLCGQPELKKDEFVK